MSRRVQVEWYTSGWSAALWLAERLKCEGLTWRVFYCTLMGPSTGSSPCSDSCFKALRAAWEERTTDGRVRGGCWWVRSEGGRERGTQWEENECHPSAAFQITLALGNLMPAGHFPSTVCCLWLLSSCCLSRIIGLTFPLYVLAALDFPQSLWATSVFSSTAAKQIAAGLKHL